MKRSMLKSDAECCNNNFLSKRSGTWKIFSLLLFVLLTSIFGNAQVPANDLCEGALAIGCGQTLEGTTDLATANDFIGSCSQDWSTSGIGVWYSLEGTGGQLILSLCHEATDYDTHLVLYSGECGNLVCVDGNDDWNNELNSISEGELEENNGGDIPPCEFSGLDSQIAWDSEAGTTYYAYVTGYSSNSGAFGFSITCNGFELPADQVVSCIEEVEIPSIEIETECEPVSELMFTSETGEPVSECIFSTAFGPGDDWAFWIPNQSALGSDDFVPSSELSFTQYADGTANLTGQVVNTVNTNETFELDFWFENAADWTDWSAQGRWYKDDLGFGADSFEEWTYYELVNGVSAATGSGDLLGDVLYFSHNPVNYFFGFQLGEGANNKNEAFGFSGWFNYTGTIYGETVSGNGDINADTECSPLSTEGCVHDTEFTYVYTVTDECGNVYTEDYVIQVLDEEAPVFTDGPDDIEISCESWPIPLEDCVAIDNCSGEITYLDPIETIEVGECPSELFVTRTWGALDACGNQATHIQNIYVFDNQAPVFTNLPEEILNIECDAVPAIALVDANDNCSEYGIEFTESIEEGLCNNQYTIIRTWLAEDACGNVSSFTQTINVSDNTAPVIDLEVIITVDCGEADQSFATVTDNCSDDSNIQVTYSDTMNSGGCAGVLSRVYTATDECGNSSQATQYITLTDNIAPTFLNVPANETAECDEVSLLENGNFFTAGSVTAEDNCAEDLEVTYSESITDGLCPNEYTIVRTWTAMDDCDNMNSASQTITVTDSTNPVFTSFPQDFSIECSEEVPAPIFPTAEDNCGEVSISVTDTAQEGDCSGTGTITRLFRAEDQCGNYALIAQTITIEDNFGPEFTFIPSDMELECDEDVPFTLAEASDLCSNVIVTSFDEESGDDCEKTITRTFIATDECGNETIATQNFLIEDNTAPTFQGPAAIEAPCDIEIENTTISALDNCNEISLTFSDENVSGGCAGQIIRTFTATDACGNSSEFIQVIDLYDLEAPEFSAFPVDMTAECSELPEVSQFVDADDNCSEVEIEYLGEVSAPGTCEGEYTLTRTWSATDFCGNESLRSQVIEVSDNTAPEFTLVPASISHECDEDPDYGMAAAEDLCSDVTVTVVEIESGDDCNLTITRTFTATDECGNFSTAEQVITITDSTAPIFTFVPENISHECDLSPDYGMATASDNCGNVTITVTSSESGDNCSSIIVRTFIAEDECGNQEFAYQEISIADTTAPELSGEANISMPCDEVDLNAQITVTDNCNDYSLTYSDLVVSGGCAGQIIRTYIATDECGNASEEFVQIIDLTDTTAPAVEFAPQNFSIECNEEFILEEALFSDNCDDQVSVIYDEVETGDSCDRTITRTWIASDNCGNETIVEQLITIEDSTPPVFDFIPADLSHECNELVQYEMATATDNCNEVMITISETETVELCLTTITRTFTATDACGNSSEASHTIQILDETSPFFTFVPSDIDHSCDENPAYGMATAEDSCTDVTVSVTEEIVEQDACSSVIQRTFIAEDACGNTEIAFQDIFIYDDAAPEFDQTLENITTQCEAPAFEVVTATDNCSSAEVTMEVTQDLDECGNGIITVTYYAADECGLEAEPISYTITIEDTEAPTLSLEPASLIIDCDDEIPAAPEVTASDNCDSEIAVEFSEITIGDAPAEGSIADCALSTPASPTCDNNVEWSLRLFEFPGYEFFTTIEASFIEYPNGTAILSGSVEAVNNPNAVFDIYVEFQDGMNWEDWSNQTHPTSFKDDCETVTDEYLDWTYYIINSDVATLTGQNDLAGSLLNLTQAPSNLYYGYQVGQSANNVNGNYGNGGWFTAEGIFMDASSETSEELTSISGDFAFDADCCPQYEVERTWTATDCSGNITTYTQTISLADLSSEEEAIAVADKTDGITQEMLTKVYPNPVTSSANFEFKSFTNDQVVVTVMDMNGSIVAEIFSGDIESKLNYTISFDASNLTAGVYVFKISGNNGVTTEKFVVTK